MAGTPLVLPIGMDSVYVCSVNLTRAFTAGTTLVIPIGMDSVYISLS